MLIIPNTTITENGNYYWIIPNSGYVLHDKMTDFETPEGEYIRTYSGDKCSCHKINYDATPFQIEIKVVDENGNISVKTVVAYGVNREFFAIKRNEVPNPNMNIYDGGGNQ